MCVSTHLSDDQASFKVVSRARGAHVLALRVAELVEAMQARGGGEGGGCNKVIIGDRKPIAARLT